MGQRPIISALTFLLLLTIGRAPIALATPLPPYFVTEKQAILRSIGKELGRADQLVKSACGRAKLSYLRADLNRDGNVDARDRLIEKVCAGQLKQMACSALLPEKFVAYKSSAALVKKRRRIYRTALFGPSRKLGDLIGRLVTLHARFDLRYFSADVNYDQKVDARDSKLLTLCTGRDVLSICVFADLNRDELIDARDWSEYELQRRRSSLPRETPSATPPGVGTQTPTGTATVTGMPSTLPTAKTPTASATFTRTSTVIPTRTATGTATRTHTPAATFTPAPPSATIMNPYWVTPGWRSWVTDQTPVSLPSYPKNVWPMPAPSGTKTYTVITPAARLYPDPLTSHLYPGKYLSFAATPQAYSGLWDDVYTTRDNGHSSMPGSYAASSGYGSAVIAGQMINVDTGTANTSTRLQVGSNFVSESLSNQGHQHHCDSSVVYDNERNYLFSNTVRASVAYSSFRDTNPLKVIDYFDGLLSHQFHSVGRSSSETHAIGKMALAGAYIPRATKDLLKRNGAYASALLYIFKAALPYSAADGSPLPFMNELRHRPAYLSNGNLANGEWMSSNFYHHGYDDNLHLYQMTQLASSMSIPPPIAVLKAVQYSVERGGTSVVTNAAPVINSWFQTLAKTAIRVWGGAGETITIRVDLGDSYDLTSQPLTYLWNVLYPGHTNVTVTPVAGHPSQFDVRASHNSSLPKGRLPVLFTVFNGAYHSNPVFLNFYWPETGQTTCDWNYTAQSGVSEVTRNLRPIINVDAEEILAAERGVELAFNIGCDDPEGFPTTFYRWQDEVGAITNNRFSFIADQSSRGSAWPIRIICSDGTGGYNSVQLDVAVNNGQGLPSGWTAADIGVTEGEGTTNWNAGAFELRGSGANLGYYALATDNGHMVFKTGEGDIDFAARITDQTVAGQPNAVVKAGVMLTDQLGSSSRRMLIHRSGNVGAATPPKVWADFRTGVGSASGGLTGGLANGSDSLLNLSDGSYLRIAKVGELVAAYVSKDRTVWEELAWVQSIITGQFAVGPIVSGVDSTYGNAIQYATARAEIVEDTKPIVIITASGRTHATNSNTNRAYLVDLAATPVVPVTITVTSPQPIDEIYYTLDGTTPTFSSSRYASPLSITAAGNYDLRVVIYRGGMAGDAAAFPFKVLN